MGHKIFGIGLHKTGTSTLARCLEILGYNVCPETLGYAVMHEVSEKKYRRCLKIAQEFEAFADSPWNYIDAYKVLDVVFPTAKFVLTTRDETVWFRSLLRWVSLHDSGKDCSMIHTVGTPVTVEHQKEATAGYRLHNKSIVDYFAKLPGADSGKKLLVVDWEAGDCWPQLCAFLGKPIPDISFPHLLKYDPENMAYTDDGISRGPVV